VRITKIRVLRDLQAIVLCSLPMEFTAKNDAIHLSKGPQNTLLKCLKTVPFRIYYARFRVKGKLIWRSLKTDKISIAKLRLDDVEKEEYKKSEAGFVQTKEKILVKNCIEAYRQKGFRPSKPRSQKDVKRLKPTSNKYYEERILALQKSWPGFDELNVKTITEKQCEEWAEKVRKGITVIPWGWKKRAGYFGFPCHTVGDE